MARWHERTHEHRTWTTTHNGVLVTVTSNPAIGWRWRVETLQASRTAGVVVTGQAEGEDEAKRFALLAAEWVSGTFGRENV